ncbi:class I SAM-dependent methyltransferase [Rhodococcus sp. NPDC058521]|uniref:class I SAM-dependent methyltransferase n=1 Tax=Rhodococcus sp. NPDC058521 TaxID=3346536 RepID=UPI003654193C
MTERIDGNTLDGVSATTLWTLRNRAEEALREDAVLEDPWAIALYKSIDYDYEKFGKASQSHPLRALAVDNAIRDYLTTHPRATIVNLGEGLQTGFWRIDNPDLAWVSVDLPPVIEARRKLLPREAQVTEYAMSATDRRWMDGVSEGDGVFITAEGLFMYLEPDEVWSLLTDMSERFPGGRIIFDSIPQWLSNKSISGLDTTDRYRMPPMPFSLTVSAIAKIPDRIPSISAVHDVVLPRGRGLWGNPLLWFVGDLPVLRNHRPSLTLAEFA